MGRKSQTLHLDIYLQGYQLGHYKKNPDGSTSFRYNKEWIAAGGFAISQSLPLVDVDYKGDIPRAYFENLLPDMEEVRKSIAAKIKAKSSEHFDLLYAIGNDCIGALRFIPKDSKALTKDSIPKGEVLDELAISELISNLKSSPLGLEKGDFRLSLAGVQEKTALLFWKDRWLLPHNSTPTTHIIKPKMRFETGGLDMSTSVDNEYFCMKLCKAFGLEVAEVDIVNFKEQKVLSVTRFDRFIDEGIIYRHPQEDFCQALGIYSTMKYQSDGGPTPQDIVQILKYSDKNTKDIEHFFQSLVVFYLLGAIDGHAKNFSIIYTPSGYKLSPLYDVLSIFPSITQKEMKIAKYKLAMSIGDNKHYSVHRISRHHFIQTAKSFNINENRANELIDNILKKVEEKVWTSISMSPFLDQKVTDKIITGLCINAKKLT